MNQVMERKTGSRQAATAHKPRRVETGFGWRQLLSRSALGAAALLAAVTLLVFKTVIPPLAIVFALLTTGSVLATRTGRKGVTGVVLAGLGAATFCVLGGGFVLGVIGAPEEPREFIPLVGSFGLSVVAVASAIALAIRGRGRSFEASRAAKGLGVTVVTLLVAMAGWSTYSGATFESATAASGDLTVGAFEFGFTPDVVRAGAGELNLFVDNTGRGLHTFTIDALQVDVAVPAGKAQRVTFQAAAGDYTFHCKLHPGMDGRLVVS